MGEETNIEQERSANFQEAFRKALREHHQKMFDSVLKRAEEIYGQQNLEQLVGGWDKARQAGVVKAVIDEETRRVTNPYFESRWPEHSPVPQSMKKIYHHVTGVWNGSAREHFLSDVLHEESQDYLAKLKQEVARLTGLTEDEDPITVAKKAEQVVNDAFQSGKLPRPSDVGHFTLYQARGDFEKEEDIYNRIKKAAKAAKV